MRLFRLQHQPTLAWQPVPLQIDWRDDEGHLLLPGSKSQRQHRIYEAARMAGFSDNDRLVFEATEWGDVFEKGDIPPCRTKRMHELKDTKGEGFLYLADCDDQTIAAPTLQDQFQYKPEQRDVETPGYQFKYDAANHILFDQILVDGTEVGKAAKLRIRSDVKRFFTLDFASGDVESIIASHRQGPLGFLANLTFYLRILFFKIDLELNTGMSFFSNAVHIPMILHMPVEAHEWLHPASGTLYSWQANPAVVKLHADEGLMPLLNAKTVLGGWEEIAKKGLTLCEGALCTYWLRGTFGERDFAMKYAIPRSLVERGFYPMLTLDAERSEVELGWRDANDVDQKQKRVGIYFESSGLRQGEHGWEFWIQLGKLGKDSHCPEEAQANRVINL
jgi:hypothetical protein